MCMLCQSRHISLHLLSIPQNLMLLLPSLNCFKLFLPALSSVVCFLRAAGASEHDLLSRIIETLGPPPAWMMAAGKRTSTFFKQVPAGAAADGSSSSSSAAAAAAAAAAGGEGGVGYRLYTKEEFEAANKTQVSVN
jgi:hypothetical protein